MFLCRTKKNRNLQDYQYVEHHIEIVSHDRDYSDVDVHDWDMLSTKTEERPIEERAESKKKKKCFTLI